ncbi:MAG TPA: hypothetical protein VMV10_00465 [Pirellulales bacterium]|nr:hypothetical protein [Pirellulales bacterium]
MIRVFSLAAVLVAVIALVGWAQNVGRPSQPQRPTRLPRGRIVEAEAPDFVPAEAPNRQPQTEPIPPNAVGLPHDIAPQHALASVADGRLKLVRFWFQNETRNVVAKIEVEGAWTSESILRTVAVGFANTSWHDLDMIRAYAGDEDLDPVQLADKLAKATHVLIATKKVDPFYLDVFEPGTIQLILPAALIEQNQPGMMGYGATGYAAPMYSAPAAVPTPAPVISQ